MFESWVAKVRRSLSIVLVGCAILYGQSKQGGICFRYDDDQPAEKIRQIAAIFQKYQFPFCWSINVDGIPGDPSYLSLIKDLQSNGCEIMDHSPNHATHVFWTIHASEYSGRPGVDHIVSNKKVCLKIKDIDRNSCFAPGEIVITQDRSVMNSAARIAGKISPENILVDDSTGRLFCIDHIAQNLPQGIDTVYLTTIWYEQVKLSPNTRLVYHLINCFDLQMTDEAASVLAQESIREFNELGLDHPTTFIQPGSIGPLLTPETIKKTYCDEFGYTAAAEDGGLKCYNNADPYGPFRMQWGGFTAGINVDQDKKTISDMIANHFFLIGGNHCWDIKMDWNTYLTQVDSLLAWCQTQHIRVMTYRQIADTLFSTPSDPYTNSIPGLQVDLNNDHIPDGYNSVTGKVDSAVYDSSMQYFIRTSKDGELFRIDSLAGIEDGNLELFFYAKGSTNAKIEIRYRLQEWLRDTTEITFSVKDTNWNKYSTSDSSQKGFFIPPGWSYIHLEVSLKNLNNKDFELGQMFLRKRTKSENVIPPFLTPITVDSTQGTLSFYVNLHNQSDTTIIERYVGNLYVDIRTINQSDVIQDRPGSVKDSVQYRAYSIVGSVASEYSYLSYGPLKKLTGVNNVKTETMSVSLSSFPNPFNSTTIISYTLPSESVVSLRVFDMLGRLVKTLISEQTLSKGNHNVHWDAVNDQGSHVSSGTYLCQFRITSSGPSQHSSVVKKLLYLK